MRKTILLWPVGLLILLAACASPERSSQENSNASGGPAIAQSGTPQPTASTSSDTQPVPPAQSPQAAAPPPKGVEPATPAGDLASVGASIVKVPKLVVPGSTINFGKQPQDKRLIRTISIRNAGSADLHIESVVPS